MLPKDYRLKKRTAFAATYRTGRTLHKDGITVFIGKEKNNDFPAGKQFFHVFLLVSSSCHARMNIFS